MKATLRGLRILVVDDEPATPRLVEQLLRRAGVSHIYWARSLDAAMGTVATRPIDVALVDLDLGGVGGVTVARALSAMESALKVVLTSAGPPPAELLDEHVFLAKPFCQEDLTTVICARTNFA